MWQNEMAPEDLSLSFQSLCDAPLGVEVPWPTCQQADRAGYQTASAVHKRISRIASAYEDFFAAEFQKYLNQ